MGCTRFMEAMSPHLLPASGMRFDKCDSTPIQDYDGDNSKEHLLLAPCHRNMQETGLGLKGKEKKERESANLKTNIVRESVGTANTLPIKVKEVGFFNTEDAQKKLSAQEAASISPIITVYRKPQSQEC